LEILNLVHEFLSKDNEDKRMKDPRHAEKRAERLALEVKVRKPLSTDMSHDIAP
jgi:lysylphosphatidylglycerol synthetase-like protein (DUF2156 family)